MAAVVDMLTRLLAEVNDTVTQERVDPEVSESDQSSVSDQLLKVIQYTNYAFICQAIDVFGVVTNIINIAVFVRLGFQDSINISLLGLSVSDLFGCLTLIFVNLALTPWFQDLELPFHPYQIQYLTAAWPHVAFTRLTSVITVFITFERCLCVIVPLKIKTLITPRRVAIFIVSAFSVTLSCFIPVYFNHSHGYVFYPPLNRSVITVIFTENRQLFEAIYYPLVGTVFPILTFLAVTVFTILLVTSLRKKAKWRKSATSGSASSEMSSKEGKISALVLTISTLFIVCFLPFTVVISWMATVSEFSIVGKEWKLFVVVCSFGFMLESINASMNIFIYYFKSTNYRTMFQSMFHMQKDSSK